MSWIKCLVAGLSPQKTGLNLISVHVGYVVDKVALRRFPVRVLRDFTVSIIPPMLHTQRLSQTL
jgi:hypothetical protein